MSAIVVKKNEVEGWWGVDFCHEGKVEIFPMGFTDKESAVKFAEHVKASAKRIIVSPSTAELEAMVARANKFLNGKSKGNP